MATLVSLQLVRVAGVGDHHATSYSVFGRRPRVLSQSRTLHGSGLKTTSQARVGSLQGGGGLCCPLWSHLLISKSSAGVRASRSPVMASSMRPIPTKQEIKQIGAMFVSYGGQLLRRIADLIQRCPPLVTNVAPAVGLVVFSVWGLGPTTRMLRRIVLKRNDKKWDESRSHNIMTSYMRPILLWIGIILICRAFDPVMLSSEASQAIKQRFVNFVRSLSTVLAFAFCTASLTQQVQRFMMENQDAEEARNVGVQFIGNTVYTSVWVAAVCLFMELLGFSTQKWITAGGFGTVLITLAGREIFTNFLSSVMIHATRPFVDNEWIQTKIEGQEVSGTVEHVGWWSPTIIRGDDREAVHIPNHKFSVNVVRNLSQKTHWRIKTHLGISHLDVSKMRPIVADMRKVLAKHPQVEQRRLHRRVFFEQLDSENQALMILISCFVKTSHFEEYLRVKEIILLDLLRVISHHGARLATPIRSVQRVLDETESRSSPFRDMRNANHPQRRPLLLLDSKVAPSDDYEDDDKDDMQDAILRLNEQLSKVDKAAAASSKDNESDESAKESGDLKPVKPKEVVANGTLRTPVAVQQSKDSTSSDGSLPQETDALENLMGSIYAGTEETLVKSDTDTSSVHHNGRPVVATHVPVAEVVVETPEEKVPQLYSNNVGLADVDASPEGEASLPSLEISVHTELTHQHVDTATTNTEEHEVQIFQNVGVHVDIGTSTTGIIEDPWKQPASLERDYNHVNGEEALVDVPSAHGDVTDLAAAAATTTTGGHQVLVTQQLHDQHVGIHVAAGNSATSSDDPWKQPSTSENEKSIARGVAEAQEDVDTDLTDEAAAPAKTTEEHEVHVTQKLNDKHVGVHVAVANSTTTTSTIDDPWKQPSTAGRDTTNASREESALEDVRSGLTDEAAAPVKAIEGHEVHVTQKLNDKHVGIHVAVANSTTTTTIDDPWKQPSTSQRDSTNAGRGELALEDVRGDLTDEAAAPVKTTEEHEVHVTQKLSDKHVGVHVAVANSSTTATAATIDDPWKQPSTSERDAMNAGREGCALKDAHSDVTDEAVAFVRTTDQRQVEITQKLNDMHVGVHVAGITTSTTSTTIDDPWRTSERDGQNATWDEDEALEAAAARSTDPWRESPASARSGSGDPWIQSAPKAAPSRPSVDPNLIPGVAIEGPKHTLPLDEDVALLDDSPDFVALGNPKSSKDRRESAAGPKGGASRDPDRD